MTEPVRNHATFIVKTEDQLRAERDALLAELDGCTDEHCPHHYLQLEELSSVRWLLGETA